MPELHGGYRSLLFAFAAPVIYFLMVLVGRQLKRRHGVRLGWLYQGFSACLAVYAPAVLLKTGWSFVPHLGAATVVLGATVLIALVDRYVWEVYFGQHHRLSVPKFLTEVVRLGILLVAVFLVLDIGYGQTMKGLLIAPGILAVVIGLAMQDLVGNIIAGVALQVGKPFVQGEWLMVEGKFAEVMEINWRATRLRTNDDVSIEIPNREMARITIFNLNRPQRRYAARISVGIEYGAPPTRVKEVLLHATANANGVAAEPKPKAYLKDFGDSAIQYEVKFWMDDPRRFFEVCDAIRTHIWYGLRRHGIRIPFPVRTVQIERPARDKEQELQSAARSILRQQALFQCLSDEQLDALLPHGRVAHFGLGETIIRQGQNGDSMFILVEGSAGVTVERNNSPVQVASLRSGDCFGEMSLLTGERRSATVVAQTDCEVVEISKPILAKSLKEHPELVRELSQLLARRQLETEGAFASAGNEGVLDAKQTHYATGFLNRLRSFFEL